MKYITAGADVVERLALGAIGQTKTYTLAGNATFANGSKSMTIAGLQDVDVRIKPNLSLQARFVEVSENARRIETYCVLSPTSERWTLAALRGIGNHLDWNSSGVSVINLVTNVETPLADPATDADPWLDYILVPDVAAKRVWALRSNTTLSAPAVGRSIQLDAAPVAIGISRSTTDQRTHLFADSTGKLYSYDHKFVSRASVELKTEVRGGAFTYTNNVVSAFVFVGAGGKLMRVALDANLGMGDIEPVDTDRVWARVQSDPTDNSRVYCVSDAVTGNAYILNGMVLTAAFAGESYTGLGLTDTGYMHGAYRKLLTDTAAVAVSYDACAGQLLYPAAGKYLSTNGKRYEAGTLTGNLPDGRTLLGIFYLNNVPHAICANATVLPLRTDSAQHATTLTINKKENSGNWMTLFIDVVGAEGVLFPLAFPDGASVVSTIDGAPAQSARNGQQVKIVVDTNTIRDNLFALAVGRNSLAEPMIPDELPDAFVIGNLYDIEPNESRTTVPVTPIAYDTPIPVHSNGIILIDGVEVPDGTMISPGQSLAIRITQSDAFVDSWWVTTGALRTTFTSMQDDQPYTTAIKSRAYMPLGKFYSRKIENTYGVRVVLELGDLGKFTNTDERSIVLGAGQNAEIEFEVTEHLHYEIPYKFGRSSHVLSIWADDHFLDTGPVSDAAPRWVATTSPAFSFASIPSGFYAVATTPAGVTVSLDGEVLDADQDARAYNHNEETIEFDLDQPLTYTAIPFADGRTLNFGDVVAKWTYDPIVAAIKLDKQQLIKVPIRDTVVNVDSLITIPRTPIVEQEPSTFVIYPLRKHQSHTRSDASTFEGVGVVRNAAPVKGGVQSPKFDHNEFTIATTDRAAAHYDARQQVRTFAELDFQIVTNTKAHHTASASKAAFRQTRHQAVESSNFTYMKRSRAETERANYSEVRPHRAAALELHVTRVLARMSEGMALDSQWAVRAVSAETKVLEAVSAVARAAIDLEIDPTFSPASNVQYLELDAVQKQILGIGSAEIIPISARDRQPDTIPLRALYKHARRSSVAVEARAFTYPKAYEMAYPIPGVSRFARGGLWQLSLAASFSQIVQASTAEGPAPNHIATPAVPTAAKNAPASQQVARLTRIGGFSAFIPSSAVVSHTPRIGEFTQTATQSFEGRKIEFNLATSHDGNPDLLDRGYFATEVEALQNAVRVWKKEPSDVVARQLPTGQWYWATPDLCVNMCVECPPYGYLSGG